VIDITRRRNAEEALKEKQHLHERLLNAIPHPAMLINTKRIVQAANKSAFDIGVKLGDYCWKEFGKCEYLSAEDKERLKNNPYDERIKCTFCKADEAMTGTKLKKMNDPEIYAFDKIWDTYWDPIDKDTFLHYAIDVTERREMERKLKAAALTDVLTGLLNRRGFLTLSEQQCKLVKRTRRRLALLYIDLNNMKKINDDFGHEEGDRALIDTARILKNTFRESDIIARIGGDEFSVLITEPAGTGIENIVINNVQDSLKAFNEKSGRPYELSLSMGFAHFDPEHNCSVGDLIHRADALMYEDKKRQLNKEVLSVLPGKKPKKRKEIRFKTGSGIGAEIEVTGNINVKNISQSGICLTNIQQHIAGKYHTLKLTCGDKMIPVKGIVVWTRLTDAQEYDAGMKFIGLTHNDKRSLEAMITGLTEQ
jgi:diguanylate cyclase (GGDEF)-like protein